MNKAIKQILAAKEYADIFEPDLSKAKDKYIELCKLCHPDVCADRDATVAFMKLNTMYHEAEAALLNDTWASSKLIIFKTIDNKTLEVRPQYRHAFECGEYLIGASHVIFVFDKTKEKYAAQFVNRVKVINFAHKEINLNFKKFFPDFLKAYETIDKEKIIVLKKNKDIYPLRSVVENLWECNIPPKHLAWMITRLINLCCCMQHMKDGVKLVHNGIALDNLFVCLDQHSICLLGGWQYAVNEGEKMLGTTKEIFDVMPPAVKTNKIASCVTDIESIKLFGRTMSNAETPPALTDYFNSGSNEDAVVELQRWDAALQSAFGARKFIKVDYTEDKIYKGV